MKGFKSFEKNYKEELFGRKEIDPDGKETIETNSSHSAALTIGFSTDGFYDVYIYQDLGAFVMNIGSNINSIKDLEKQYDEVLKCNPYHKILNMIKQGYEFCLGPAFPLNSGKVSNHCIGLFCKNYQLMAKQEAESLII